MEVIEYNNQLQADVAALIVSIQRDEFGIPITLADQPDLQSIATFYQSGTGDFWVAVSEGKVVGTVGLLDIGAQQVALRKMFVAKEFRGSGAAQALLQKAVNHCRANNLREIYLGTTDKFLAAHRFYEKNGFVRIEADLLPKRFARMDVDTVFYRLRLV